MMKQNYVLKFARYSPASHLQSVKIFAVVTASHLFIFVFTVCVIACCSQSNFVRHRTPAAFRAKVTVLHMEMKVRMRNTLLSHERWFRPLNPLPSR